MAKVNAGKAAKSSSSSFPLITVASGLWSYLSVPAISAAGGKGIAAAALIGLATGFGASVIGFVGVLGGAVVGAATFGAVGAIAKNPRAGVLLGGIGGAILGGIAGTVLGAIETYKFSKDIALENLPEVEETVSEDMRMSSLSELPSLADTANAKFDYDANTFDLKAAALKPKITMAMPR